jgi:hypothetical protein
VDQSQKAVEDTLATRWVLGLARLGEPGGAPLVASGIGLQVADVLIGQSLIDLVGEHGDLL